MTARAWRYRRIDDHFRRSLSPITKHLGLDYSVAFFTPPTTDEAIALDVFRCGQWLFDVLTDPDTWTAYGADSNRPDKQARVLAKRLKSSMLEPRGPSAFSYVAQGYATEMAAFWRRASSTKDARDAATLMWNAERSEALGALAARYWPVDDPLQALSWVAQSEKARFYDPDDPNAAMDLHGVAGRARVMCGAAALGLGSNLDEFDSFVVAPILMLEMQFDLLVNTAWARWLDAWANLMTNEPHAFIEVMRGRET